MFHTRKFAVALVVVAALAAVSCSNDDSVTSTASMGQVKLEMGVTSSGTLAASTTGETDAALSTLEVTLESVRARMTDGTWHEIPGTYPMTVDVLALAAAGEVTVGAGLLPAGSYDALEVVFSSASATFDDATEITVDFPPPGKTVLIAVSFEVVEGEETFLDIHLDVDLSFKLAGGSLEFDPVFTVEVDAQDD